MFIHTRDTFSLLLVENVYLCILSASEYVTMTARAISAADITVLALSTAESVKY